MDNENNDQPVEQKENINIENFEKPVEPQSIEPQFNKPDERVVESNTEEKDKTSLLVEEPKHTDDSRNSRRKTIVIVILVAIILICCYLLFIINGQGVGLHRADVSLASGKVEKNEGSSWVALKTSDDVKQGDQVRITGEGKAIITLDDGSAIRLDSDSGVKLVSLDPKDIQITNEKGEVYTRVVKADRPFVVKVDDESYKAMGTAYKTVNEEGQSGVYVYESKVKAVKKNADIDQGNKLLEENASDTSVAGKIIGITDEEINDDDFLQWNKEQDLKDKDFKKNMGVLKEVEETTNTTNTTEEQKTETTNSENQTTNNTVSGYINLTGSASSSGVNLNWSVSNVDVSKGFKVVRSTSAYPVFPGNDYQYLSSGSATGYSWAIADGVTYHFRVCQYLGGSCGVYSNDITVTAPYVAPTASVSNIVLSGAGGNSVSWVTTGYSSKGFKVVWSKESKPEYPLRKNTTGVAYDDYHYYDSPEQKTDTIEASFGSGTYHIRVCEYLLGGRCGLYSNEITVDL